MISMVSFSPMNDESMISIMSLWVYVLGITLLTVV